MSKLEYETSSGNVFQDMDLPNAQERLAKARLASKIIEISEKKHLTQKKIASFLGIDQPKVSALYCGRLSGFSISRLIKFLILLKYDVEIIVKETSKDHETVGHLSVISNNALIETQHSEKS